MIINNDLKTQKPSKQIWSGMYIGWGGTYATICFQENDTERKQNTSWNFIKYLFYEIERK